MNEDVVYFELNNWFPGRDYPNVEPFTTWCGDDLDLYFSNAEFVKEHKLCVVESFIDMSVNWCVTAPRSFVEEFCPKLLSDESTEFTVHTHCNGEDTTETKSVPYKDFLRFPASNGEVYGKFGDEFLMYSDDNVGIHAGQDL